MLVTFASVAFTRPICANATLTEFSIPEFINNGFKMTDFSVDYHRHENDDILTGYETKFKEMGQPIYFAKFIKC